MRKEPFEGRSAPTEKLLTCVKESLPVALPLREGSGGRTRERGTVFLVPYTAATTKHATMMKTHDFRACKCLEARVRASRGDLRLNFLDKETRISNADLVQKQKRRLNLAPPFRRHSTTAKRTGSRAVPSFLFYFSWFLHCFNLFARVTTFMLLHQLSLCKHVEHPLAPPPTPLLSITAQRRSKLCREEKNASLNQTTLCVCEGQYTPSSRNAPIPSKMRCQTTCRSPHPWSSKSPPTTPSLQFRRVSTGDAAHASHKSFRSDS